MQRIEKCLMRKITSVLECKSEVKKAQDVSRGFESIWDLVNKKFLTQLCLCGQHLKTQWSASQRDLRLLGSITPQDLQDLFALICGPQNFK